MKKFSAKSLKKSSVLLKHLANIEELVFDAVFFVLYLILSVYYNDTRIIALLNPLFLIVLLFFIEIMVPLYIALIYSQYRNKSGSSIFYKVFSKFVLLSGITVSLGLCFYMPFAIGDFKDDGYITVYAVINFLLGFLIIALGWDLGTKIGKPGKEVFQNINTIITVIYYCAVPILSLAALIFSLMKKDFTPVAVVSFFIFLLLAFDKYKDRMESFFENSLFKNIFLPLIMCTLFYISMDFMSDLLPFHFKENYGIALLLTGILPIRVMLLFTPPVKPLNLLIGGVVLWLTIKGVC